VQKKYKWRGKLVNNDIPYPVNKKNIPGNSEPRKNFLAALKISRCARNDTVTAMNEADNLRHALLTPTDTPCHFDTDITCHFDTNITCHFDERSEEKSFIPPHPPSHPVISTNEVRRNLQRHDNF